MSGPEAKIQRDIQIAIGALPGVHHDRGAIRIEDPLDARVRFVPSLGPGTGDLVGCVAGVHVELEVKAPDGRPEATQLKRQGWIRAAGGLYEFVRSPAEALAVVERARVIPRLRAALARYGAHAAGCPGPGGCTCGFEAARRALLAEGAPR